MELQEFNKQSLVQIVAVMAEAQKAVVDHGVVVNPSGLLSGGEKLTGHAKTIEGNFTQNIEFDVAVTSTEGTGSKGGVGIVMGTIALGTQANSSQSAQAISRIRFTIPMLLPSARLEDAAKLLQSMEESARRVSGNDDDPFRRIE